MELSLHRWFLLALLFSQKLACAVQTATQLQQRGGTVRGPALTSLAAQDTTPHRSLLDDGSGGKQSEAIDSDNDCSWVEKYTQLHKEKRGAADAKYLVFGCFKNQGKRCGGQQEYALQAGEQVLHAIQPKHTLLVACTITIY